MAVKRCPQCGDLYLSDVNRCVSCDTALVTVDTSEEGPDERAPGPSDPVFERRELHAWTMEGRRLLDGMLHRAAIPRSWQGATLLTPEPERDRVEEMVAVVGAGDAQVGESDPAEAEPAEPDNAGGDVAYDLTGWSDVARGHLIAALAEAGVEHGWDEEDDLVVDAADENQVDAIFDRLAGASDTDTLGGDDPEGDGEGWEDDHDDDGLLVQETLSDLFVGADRLLSNPLDGNALLLVMDARDQARSLRLPFGFERTQWRAILDAANALADGAAPDSGGDEQIRDHAARLRTLLRDVV